MTIQNNLIKLKSEIPSPVELVAVSKTKSIDVIMEAYNSGQRIFGENRIQEMIQKYDSLPKDIEWHMIGHLQRNKIKYIAPFVSLIHGIDTLKLLFEINKHANKNKRIINCLLQVHIAKESTKYGFNHLELEDVLIESKKMKNISIVGLMGMATFTSNKSLIDSEFKFLRSIYDGYKSTYSNFKILSMGMSGDYNTAISNGSNMIRVGSKIFGERI